ncbi:MAG: 3-oxoacyl-ACP synthase [Bacteroidales bacterium]|nr:3-oxoacyl-ACP synthase [Bacteroidales bacterium]MBK9357042.1 3-oxoacyl-ACP synthase [Bacteroidales bacterium]
MNNPVIRKYVSVDKRSVKVNGTDLLLNEQGADFGEFMKQIYHACSISYLKFFKMDPQSKLGFVAAKILLQDDDRDRFEPEEKAIVLANSASSLNTDEKYFESINDIPSPAVFVYTLPNIVAGEICIHHNLKGENTFFIQEEFDIQFMVSYLNILFSTTNTRKAIAGWVEVDLDDNYRAFLMDVEKEGSSEIQGNFTVDFIHQIFKL